MQNHEFNNQDSASNNAASLNISINDQQREGSMRDRSQPRDAVSDNQSQIDDRSIDRSIQRSRTPSALNASQNNDQAEDSKKDERPQERYISKDVSYRRPEWTESSATHQQQRQPVQDYNRRSISPHLQSEYEKTQQVLNQVRARSREQVSMNPAGGNGYERHNGSPQRCSPQRQQQHSPGFSPQQQETYVAPRAPYHPQQQSITSSITNTYRKVSPSPLQETQNFRGNEQPISITNARDASRGDSANRYSAQVSQRDKENSHSQQQQVQRVRHSSSSATRVIEHTKTVTATVTTAQIRCSENIHDSIINSYRRQLQNSSNLDSMFEALKMRVADVQTRKTALEDSIRYLSQDYEKQIEQQTSEQENLQRELESLKRQNADLGQDCTTVNSDIMDSKAIVNQKELEIQRIRTDIQRSQDEGRFTKDNIEDAKRQLSINYQTKSQQHQKIFQLTAQLKQQETQNFTSTSDSNTKTQEVNNLNEQMRRLNDTLHQKTVQHEDTSTKFEIARAEHLRNQNEVQALQKDCDNANQRNGFLLETQRQLVRQKESESGRYSELTCELSRSESSYIQSDNELQALSHELEAIRKSNESLLEAGHCYKQELHALQNHADLLALQNNDLQKELDEFVMTDEIIRSGLDRKGRVNEMKQTNTIRTTESMMRVEKSRSPTRSASRSPLRSMTNTQKVGGNSLTQAYLSYNRQEQQQPVQQQPQQQTYQGYQPATSSIQEQCRRQLQENVRNQEQSMNFRDARKESPTQYRVRNGSPLRNSPRR